MKYVIIEDFKGLAYLGTVDSSGEVLDTIRTSLEEFGGLTAKELKDRMAAYRDQEDCCCGQLPATFDRLLRVGTVKTFIGLEPRVSLQVVQFRQVRAHLRLSP